MATSIGLQFGTISVIFDDKGNPKEWSPPVQRKLRNDTVKGYIKTFNFAPAFVNIPNIFPSLTQIDLNASDPNKGISNIRFQVSVDSASPDKFTLFIAAWSGTIFAPDGGATIQWLAVG